MSAQNYKNAWRFVRRQRTHVRRPRHHERGERCRGIVTSRCLVFVLSVVINDQWIHRSR